MATHGLVDETFENLFGGLVFAVPKQGQTGADDDGLMTLSEIHRLKMSQCELAILSACRTNVGPDRPMDAGCSLANALFVAGARRVVASHWSVEDDSTAELMGDFLEQIATSTLAKRPVDYATCLRNAQRKLRDQTRWSAPFFWAPFILLGPGNEPLAPPSLPTTR